MNIQNCICKISRLTAAAGVWMVPALALTIFYDVMMRYLFKAPTFWAYETSWMLYSASFLLGMAFALQQGAHVRVDIFLSRFPLKTKKYFEVFFLLLMLIFCAVVTWHGTIYAFDAWKLLEGSHITIWAPPIYPIKTLIPLSFFVLGLQTFAELINKLAKVD